MPKYGNVTTSDDDHVTMTLDGILHVEIAKRRRCGAMGCQQFLPFFLVHSDTSGVFLTPPRRALKGAHAILFACNFCQP